MTASDAPSVKASNTPSVTGSSTPSLVVSNTPSMKASNVPSVTGSSAPSLVASNAPSVTASDAPSVKASNIPSITGSSTPSLVVSNAPSMKASNVPSVTGSSAPSLCLDEKAYRSPINDNFGCELYCGTDCFKWSKMLNIIELQEVFRSCPVSCKVPCDFIFTSLSPTSTVSLVPTFSSNVPSSAPEGPSIAPSTPSPSEPASDQPIRCGIPDNELFPTILEKLEEVSDPTLLLDPSSPQGKAINWLVYEDTALLCPNEQYGCPNRLEQRYALAVTYFSTGGDQWSKCKRSDENCGTEIPFKSKNETNFLSGNHECTWAGIDCLELSNCVNDINFENNNIVGTIPTEISALVHLERWAMEQGGLSSTIPSSIGALKNLKVLDLDFNALTGTYQRPFMVRFESKRSALLFTYTSLLSNVSRYFALRALFIVQSIAT